jgi:hypothetical protein
VPGPGSVRVAYLIDFKSYFAAEMNALADLAKQGLVELSDTGIQVTPMAGSLCGPSPWSSTAICRPTAHERSFPRSSERHHADLDGRNGAADL